MDALDKLIGMYVEVPFKWRDRHGDLHNPADMQTKHLFHTLRMIWNHSAPPHLQLHPFRKYSYPAFYTPKYMGHAILALFHELNKRDLNDYQMNTLQRMAERACDLKEYYQEKVPKPPSR